METEIRIRAFRATSDPETCARFYYSHKKVLENHGIYKVTSSSGDWMKNSSVFVIVVETLDGSKLYGGARVHAADGILPLPIEQAIGKMDPAIHGYIREYALQGTGELCGLWNSVEVAGLGIGSLFPARTAVLITERLGFKTLFSLCSPATVRFNKWLGSRVFTRVGNEGTFYYPKLDLLATVVYIDDVHALTHAHMREKQKMMYLRKHPITVISEASPFKKNVNVNIHYDLSLPDIKPNEFKLNLYPQAV